MTIISKPIIFAFASTVLAGSLGTYVWQEEHRLPLLEIYVFSLSSGRSMFIRTPEDKRILIDGGSNSEIIRELSKIIPFYSRRIDSVVATNTEGKNVSGLIDIIERYNVGKAYIPAVTLKSLGLIDQSDQIYSTFLDSLEQKGIEIEEVISGDNISLGSEVFFKVLFPTDDKKFSYSKASAPETLFRISYGSKSVIFLGNASNKIQKFIASSTLSSLNSGKDDVLIVSHSALPANISKQLIDKIKPDYLIYSKKNSSVSSSKKQTIDPLAYLSGSRKLNLKEKGIIKIISDGLRIEISDSSL